MIALKVLVTCMSKDWNLIIDKRNRRTMLDVAKMTRSLSIHSSLMCQIVVIIYVALRYFISRKIGHQILFRAYFPYNTTISPLYELTFVAQAIAAAYAAMMYTAVDTFIATLVLHTCGQLSNLRRELTELCAGEREKFRMRLGQLVSRHEYLNRWAISSW